jgi:hypothetical protein
MMPAMARTALLAALLLCGPARADDWWQSVLGGYQGPVLNDGRIEQMDTEFSVDAGGRLVGHYHVEDTPPFDGELSDFHADGPLSGSFTWHDRYGQGIVHLEFDPVRGRFLGNWGTDIPQGGLIFNGYRIRPPATS